mgnify:CR=1 FL=1
MEIKEAIKIRITELCNEKNITIYELSKLSGIRATTVYSIIDGKSDNPSIISIKKICKGLNISLRNFFNDELFDNID